MSAPLTYEDECGPRALAAVLGMPSCAAADVLWPARLFWLDAGRPGGPGIHGTPERALQDCLLRTGCELDWYGGCATLLADTAVLAGLLRREAHERSVRKLMIVRGEGPSEAPSRPLPDWFPDLRTLHEWMQRHRAGLWLYLVTDGLASHVIACRGPDVLAGDPDGSYRTPKWRVYQALRVLPPRSFPTGNPT